MKIKLRNILVAILAAVAAVCCSLGFAACGNTLTELTVENYRFEFLVGDTFEFGEYFTVYANYRDGTKVDVTEEINKETDIKFETGFDMNVADDYQITVSYQGKKAVYTIYVGTFTNKLLKLDIDAQEAKTQYKLGESISFDNLKVASTYENAQGEQISETTSGIKGFNVSIVNDVSGNSTEEVLQEFGDFTVTISKNGVKASYKINVDGVEISTVQGAVTTGVFFKENIVSGAVSTYSSLAGGPNTQIVSTDYAFGDNYTYINERSAPAGTYYMSMDEQGLFFLYSQGGKFVYSSYNEAMFNGPRILLWYYGVTEYGAENALINMYNQAKKATNNDLVETADEQTRTYSFTFSGLVLTGNARPDYYENEVSFTLSENYAITSLTIKQTEWENNLALFDEEHLKDAMFYTDPETGITTPNTTIRPSSLVTVNVRQEEGERTATNPYKRDDFIISSFDIIYNGKVLEDGAVIDCDMKNPDFKLQLGNISPATASFDFDMLLVNYEGSFMGDGQLVDFEGFTAYPVGNYINVVLRNGGVWTLILKTAKVTKTITFNVTGVNPTSMDAKIRNDAAEIFSSAQNKLIALNGWVYFYGEVNKYANPVQSAEVTSGNAANAKIESVEINGVKCFKFTATQKGTYIVKVSSGVAANVSCTFTFEVGDVPDYANILKGDYSVKDREGNILELKFTNSGADGEISGTFIYTETDKEGNSLIETYSYSVDTDRMIIDVEHISGEQLSVTLSVNASGKLVLTDAYSVSYELNPVE